MKKSKIPAMLLALVASICLWVYAVTVVNPEDTSSISGIPIVFEGSSDLEKRGLMVTGGENSKVSVKLKGTRADLKELSNDTLVAVVNLSRITEAGEHDVSWSLEYPGNVASGDISTESRSGNIHLSISEIRERSFELELDYSVIAAEDHWTREDLASLTPQSVTVKGPAEEVGLIDKVVVRPQQTEPATDTVEEILTPVYLDAEGNEMTLSSYCAVSAESVELVLPVYHSKEVELQVEFVAGGGLTAEDVDCRISPSKITVTGDPEALEKVPDRLYIDRVELASYIDEGVPQIMMEDINEMLPEGVTNRSTRTTVDTVLEISSTIVTKEFTIPMDQILRKDTLEGFGLAEGEVRITIRGRSVQMNALGTDDIKVYADLNRNYDPETGLVTLTVELPEGSPLGVILGPYTAQVIEVPAEPET
ncbi:MAG: hypothetical protein IJ357_05955 [Oscillospiraceae bacterium]|nr:hypothetical protein [Oscillospiraceae bacterium]